MNTQPKFKMPIIIPSRPDHDAAIPLLYAALAALHVAGSLQEIASSLIYLFLAIRHLQITTGPPKEG